MVQLPVIDVDHQLLDAKPWAPCSCLFDRDHKFAGRQALGSLFWCHCCNNLLSEDNSFDSRLQHAIEWLGLIHSGSVKQQLVNYG